MKEIRILVCDDHAITRMGICSLLGAEKGLSVCAQAEDGEEAVALARKHRPDVIIMDLMLPGISGAEATKRILAEAPDTGILIFTTFGTANALAEAIESGARGALLKTTAPREIIGAVRTIARGGGCLSREIRQLLDNNGPALKLTSRQLEILDLLTRGYTNDDIVTALQISLPMVKEHLADTFHRIGASNRNEAVGIALRRHLISE